MFKSFRVVLFLILLQITDTIAQKRDSTWVLAKNKNDIELYARFPEESRFKEVKATCVFAAQIPDLVETVLDVESYPDWVSNIKEAGTLKKVGEHEYINYYIADFPWPLKDRDVVLNTILVQEEDSKSVRHYFKAGIEIPLQYALQYEMRAGNRFSVNAQFGVLTNPHNDAILFTLESFGVDEKTIRLIENAFQFGLIVDLGGHYHFGKNYIGVYGQWINLTAADTPFELVESYFGISFPTPPFSPGFVPEVSLQSELFQLGLLYGRRFSFKNHPAIEIHTEFAVSKNLGSRSKLSSDNIEVDFVNNQVDNELDDIFSDYAYIPTINIFFVYQFGN